jgi:hypothetical protein
MNLEFNENTYQEYIRNREYPSNTRIRPDTMSFMDVIIKGQELMESTEEGQKTLEYMSLLGKTSGK